eukprot:scaffold20189_cov58-Phaeocystis_antarctica.AAC.2
MCPSVPRCVPSDSVGVAQPSGETKARGARTQSQTQTRCVSWRNSGSAGRQSQRREMGTWMRTEFSKNRWANFF